MIHKGFYPLSWMQVMPGLYAKETSPNHTESGSPGGRKRVSNENAC